MKYSEPMSPQTGAKVRLGTSFLYNMRDSLQELNRSMESIQKMVERSRKIISDSRKNSQNKSLKLSKNIDQSPKMNITGSPAAKAHKNAQQQSIKSPKYMQKQDHDDAQTKYKRTHSRSKTFSNNWSANQSGHNAQTMDYQHPNLLKMKPKTVRLQINLRKNVEKDSLANNTMQMKQKIQQKPSQTKQKQKRSPFQLKEVNMIHDVERTTKSREKNTQQNTSKNNKIKLKPKQTVFVALANQFKPTAREKTENIKIEDQQNHFNVQQLQKIQKSVEIDSQRYKTQYKSDKFSDFTLSNCKLDQPTTTQDLHNRLGTQTVKKENKGQSYRHPPVQLLKLKQNRKMLVKQLSKLQTVSVNEEERRSKFILKIKKYGFVEKHLNQSQIWGIYDYLVSNNVGQLKWPIHIVDQVYKKMKSTK